MIIIFILLIIIINGVSISFSITIISHCLNQRDEILMGGRDEKYWRLYCSERKMMESLSRERSTHSERTRSSQSTCLYQRWTKTIAWQSKSNKKGDGVPGKKETLQSFLGMAGYLGNFIKNYAATAAPLYQLTWEETKFYWGKQEETAFRKIQDSISNEETMTFFDPSKPIILLFKTSVHEGLSAALLQKSNRGKQPAHFISWKMATETEKNS